MRSSGHLLSSLARREMTGRWRPLAPVRPRFTLALTESQACEHIFLGFLTGSELVLSFRCALAGAELEPDGDLALGGGVLSLKFWRTWPAGPDRLEMAPLWERDVLEGSEVLGQFQPRLLFYEFPRAGRFLAFFLWDLVDRRGRPLWHVRLLAGRTPSAACSGCRRRSDSCPQHALAVVSEFRVKSERGGDIRACLRPLSPSRVLLLRPHKALLTAVNFELLPAGEPLPLLRVPSFGGAVKLHFAGCTEGICSRCFQAWAGSYRAAASARLHEDLPAPAAVCPLSASRSRPLEAPRCVACELADRLRQRPDDLDLVVNVSGLIDSHDRLDWAADGLTCPGVGLLLADCYAHWQKRRCRLPDSAPGRRPLAPRLLSRAPLQLAACTPMPWLLMNSQRCLSYASELCFARSAAGTEPTDEADADDSYDIPLVSAGLHLSHASARTELASVTRPPPPGHAAARIEELVLSLRPLLHRRFQMDPFGPEPELVLAAAAPNRLAVRVVPWDWREGRGIRVQWDLDSGDVTAVKEEWPGRAKAWEEAKVSGPPGSNAALLPDLGARLLEYFPDSLDAPESLHQLIDDSGMFCIRKGEQ